MKRKEEISKELSSISQIVADIPFRPTFSVAPDYFDQLSADTLLQVADKTVVFSTPENYFEILPLQTIQKTAAANKQQMPYEVPDGYFDALGEAVLNKIDKAQKTGNVVRLFTRWSMAAVWIGLLGLGFTAFYNWAQNDNALPSEWVAANKIIAQQSFEKEWELLDEKTMMEYLDQTGHDVESALVASLTEEDNNLPNAEDYMIEASTLNEYLYKTNIIEFNNSKN